MTERPIQTGRSEGDNAEVVRREEELAVETTPKEAGSLRVRKAVDTYPIDKVIERSSERITDASERVPAPEGDSGEIETLPDGSISIPVFEEELVVTKRVVVRERVIVRKSTVIDEHRIETDLRRERVDIDADPGVMAADQSDVLAGNEPGSESR
jgi:uncharacterized protein (TIGR02271 family)